MIRGTFSISSGWWVLLHTGRASRKIILIKSENLWSKINIAKLKECLHSHLPSEARIITDDWVSTFWVTSVSVLLGVKSNHMPFQSNLFHSISSWNCMCPQWHIRIPGSRHLPPHLERCSHMKSPLPGPQMSRCPCRLSLISFLKETQMPWKHSKAKAVTQDEFRRIYSEIHELSILLYT